MKRVLVLTTEPLPLPASVTTGAGLRAWGLAEALREGGLDVVIGTPVHGDENPAPPPAVYEHVRYFRRNAIGALVHKERPDVVVLQHWGLAAEVPELSVPFVIDLAGPHLLERQFWGSSDPVHDREEKLAAIRRADFVTCSGNKQLEYFRTFLQEAGYDTTRHDVPVIPFSVPPGVSIGQRRGSDREMTFIYGGAFLAWQDPTLPISWLLDELNRAATGRLLFYGGSHPVIDASGGRFTKLMQTLSNHPRVEVRGWKPFDELLEEYRREGDVALDLMARNRERELAFTTRTMIYLHCGLPVIYNDYSELSEIIQAAHAGWTMDPSGEQEFRSLVARILRREVPLNEFSERALRLAEQYDWAKTGGPLVDFCSNPHMREGRVEFALAHESHQHHASGQLSRKRMPLMTGLRLKLRPGRLLAPFVYVAIWPIALYIWFRLRRTLPRS